MLGFYLHFLCNNDDDDDNEDEDDDDDDYYDNIYLLTGREVFAGKSEAPVSVRKTERGD